MSESNSVPTPIVHMVRAEGGKYAHAFQQGGYVAIGWFEGQDLLPILQTNDKETLKKLYQEHYEDSSSVRIGQNVATIWRFLTEVTAGTFVVTPTDDSGKLLVGKVTGDYYHASGALDSPLPHRKQVEWFDELLTRNTLSIPTQNTLGSLLAVFKIPQYDEILSQYKVPFPSKQSRIVVTDSTVNKLILSSILELSAGDFEILVTELLTAIGFEARHVGKSGDDGIDVAGVLRVYEFAEVDLKVQVKRYKLQSKINQAAVKHFRSSVPEKSQAAFVTTADFASKARDEAEKTGFKKIGLINGSQLVDILIEHYAALSPEMREKLNLRPTLIPIAWR